MITKETIEEVKNRLIKTYDPIAIYIFGSYAWGTPTEDSDLDLLIIVESASEKSYERPRPGQKALFGLGISKDMIVFTRDEFEKKSQQPTSLCHKIKTQGKVLYARA